MVGFNGLKGLSQPKYFHDSVIFRELESPGYFTSKSQEQDKPREKFRCRPPTHIYISAHISIYLQLDPKIRQLQLPSWYLISSTVRIHVSQADPPLPQLLEDLRVTHNASIVSHSPAHLPTCANS